MVDSSTQAGTDWMISCFSEIAGDKLLELSAGLDRLHLLRANPAAASVGELAYLEELVVSSISMHTLPPVAIGSGASNLSHKVMAYGSSLPYVLIIYIYIYFISPWQLYH